MKLYICISDEPWDYCEDYLREENFSVEFLGVFDAHEKAVTACNNYIDKEIRSYYGDNLIVEMIGNSKISWKTKEPPKICSWGNIYITEVELNDERRFCFEEV